MTQSVAEVLILTINALGAGILMFIAGVVQKIMNDLDELEFKRFLNLLDRSAMADPVAVTVASVPILAAVLYVVAILAIPLLWLARTYTPGAARAVYV